jgi:secreted trypsin-like serine protease
MQVDLIVQRKDNCLIQYIDQDQFCAGNTLKKKDTCNGDSGGPLVSFIFNFLKKES